MRIEFISFVAFAISTQCSSGQESTVYGLSDSKSSQFHEITDDAGMTFSGDADAVGSIFDIIEVRSVIQQYNLHANNENKNISSMFAEVFVIAKNATDHLFDSISTILGKTCPAVEAARSTGYADLKSAYGQIGSAIALAGSGNHTDIRTEFAAFSAESKEFLKNLTVKIYDAIRTCANTTNTETLAAIKVRENGATEGIFRINDAIFDTIKLFAARISTKNSRVDVVPDINNSRDQAASGVKDFMDNSFSSIKGVYVSSQLNRPGIAAGLISDQYAQIVSDRNYKDSVGVMFDVIRGYMTKVQLGLSGACNDDSSAIDVAQAASAAHFRTATNVLTDSISLSDPVTSTAVKAARTFLNQFTDAAAAIYYDGIKLARGQGSTYSGTLKKIKTVENALQNSLSKFVGTIFGVIQSGSIGGGKSGTNFQQNTFVAVQSCVDNVFAAIRLMAKACHGVKGVNETDFKILETITTNENYAVGNFTLNVSSGHVSLIKKLNAIRNIIPNISPIKPSSALNFG